MDNRRTVIFDRNNESVVDEVVANAIGDWTVGHCQLPPANSPDALVKTGMDSDFLTDWVYTATPKYSDKSITFVLYFHLVSRGNSVLFDEEGVSVEAEFALPFGYGIVKQLKAITLRNGRGCPDVETLITRLRSAVITSKLRKHA